MNILHILHVEDSAYDRDLVQHALAHAGISGIEFAPTFASNREQFETALARGGYDCVLSDFNIRGYTGLAVFDAVRAIDPGLPVVILTGTGSEEMAVAAMKHGVADYILKSPQHIRRLPTALQHVIEQSRLAAQLTAQQAQIALAAKVFEASGEGILICDAERNILAVNPYFCAATGYSPAEVIGRNPRLLKSDRQDESYYQRMWANIQTIGNWRGEIVNRAKDGQLINEWLSISTVRDAAGTPTHYIGIFSDLPERREMDERLRHLVQHDPLTDLPSRDLFLDRIEQAIPNARRFGRGFALLWVDLARFRVLNDRYGHRVGDTVLREVGARLAGLTRDGDTAARLSADEFGLLMTNLHAENDVITLARRVIETIAMPMMLDGDAIVLGCDIGISLFPKDGETSAALLKAADLALERAKAGGRDSFRFFSASMDSHAERQLRLETDLCIAMQQGQIHLHYQPQIDLASGHINGIEALLRWEHPVMGPISPVEFIPLAEETGQIQALGNWVLKEACAQCRRWQDGGLPPLPIAVNLSVKQFHQPDLVDIIATTLAESGLAPRLLELELTESAFIGDVVEAASIIQRIKALGVQLALDDFGTGYSSLAYLSGFPFDKIKIDQSFVHDITENPVNAAIATATIAMARSLNLVVLAEGVETDAQMQFLRTRRCEAIQGHLFSKALPADEVTRLLLAHQGLKVDAGETVADTLLIVDDEIGVLNAIHRLLRRDGYRILTAESPAAAFELLAQQPVQVIISDQRMPDMSGTEFFARVKQMYPKTVRIVLSGYTDLQSVTEAINRGAIYRFLTKPWDDEALRTQVREAFRVAHGLADA